MRAHSPTSHSPKRVVVVGAGGNIGSHLVPHLARMSNIGLITLIDRDSYESSNLASQDIASRDVGKRKAVVQARKLRRINPALQVEAVCDAVERVPLGRLRADVILACLDSRIARQHVSQCAWRLGVPLIDAGVEPGSLLARINVYAPGPENPCLECAWDDRDYEALEQSYPCAGLSARVAATNGPSSLGSLAASLQAIECGKLLSGRDELVAANKQVLLDAAHHRQYVTSFRRNPRCRFAGHDVWRIQRLEVSPKEMTLAEALRLGSEGGPDGARSLRVEGSLFVGRLICTACGSERRLLRLESSLGKRAKACPKCGNRMTANGFGSMERLSENSGPTRLLARSMSSLGMRPGEVFSVSDGKRELHYEFAERQSDRPRSQPAR